MASTKESGSNIDRKKALESLLASDDKAAKREFLKSTYTPLKRFSDIFWTITFSVLFFPSLYNVAVNTTTEVLWVGVVAFMCSMVVADFLSGVVHWAADTWGTFETPFFGPTFIRSFREHHVSPTAMCQHDFFETNGDNFLLVTPVLYLLLRKNVLLEDGSVSWVAYFNLTFWTFTCLWIAFTNQFHSWAHNSKPPKIAVILQKAGIILSPEAHRKHHQIPFDKNYCITNGWMDYPLAYINFWRRAEAWWSSLTGMVPREDDYKWNGLVNEEPEVLQRYKAAKAKQK